MYQPFRNMWDDYVEPMFKRPEKVQFAALCHRGTGAERRVLLITSRGTGRWIIPKGWPVKGRDAPGSALQEAWEEAGVRANPSCGDALGSYLYAKGLSSGWSIPVRTYVYPFEVTGMSDDYPEVGQRRRRWVRPEEAAQMVDEPELKEILAAF